MRMYRFLLGAVAGAVAVTMVGHVQRPSSGGDGATWDTASSRVGQAAQELAATPSSNDEASAAAATDSETAIEALAGLREPNAILAAAATALELIGNDDGGVARVAAELPAELRFAFTVDALVARAARDPIAALEAAIAQGPTHARVALHGIASAAARRDPLAALAHARTIVDVDVANAYESALLEEWASFDASATVDYLASAARDARPSDVAMLQTIATFAPKQLLTALDRLPSPMRSMAEHAAVGALGELDPETAVEYLHALPPERRSSQLLEAVALSYGRGDPDAALEWARSLSPPSSIALEGVIAGIAVHDFDRALSLMLDRLARGPLGQFLAAETTGLAAGMLATAAEGDTYRLRRLAEAMLDFESANSNSVLDATLTRWAQTDPIGAIDWTVANAVRLTGIERTSLETTAKRIAGISPSAAASAVERLAPELAAYWIRGTTSGLLEHNPEAALRFLDSHRGHPIYEETFRAMAMELSRTYPEQATRLLLEHGASSLEYFASLSLAVSYWAYRDPHAAAEVSNAVPDKETRRAGIMNTVQLWTFTDPGNARNWILALPADDVRDAAIGVFLRANAATGSLDERLLAAFSSESAREAGLAPAIVDIAKTHPSEARRLLDTHITNPALHRETELEIARKAGALR